jgi:hypothetical protein
MRNSLFKPRSLTLIVDGESALKKTISRFPRLQHTIIVAALVAPLLSLTAAPAHAVAATCAEGGVCQVGDIGPGGGKVFYVAPTTFTQISASGTMCTTNCKYLEAAPNTWSGGSSDPARTWATNVNSNQTTAVTGADGTAIGTGYKNSLDIVAQTGNVAASSAAVAARGYTPTVSGITYSDWYLPSKAELNELYIRKASVGGFVDSNYWSSSEYDASIAWGQIFNGGNQYNAYKFYEYYVRPVRAFAPATQIAITRAAVGTQRGAAFTTQPQITIQYTNNDTVTVSSAVVTATISSGGTLVGTTTATASSGVATFSNLGVNGTVGITYTISYTALDLPVATATVTLTGTTCDGNTFTCQVGDTGPGGGKIFYVDPTTFTQIGASGTMCSTWCKYLEAAPNTWSGVSGDPTRSWSTGPNQSIGVLGADETAIGTGYQNSLDIVAQSGNVAATSAAVAAREYTPTVSGVTFSDWYLPSKAEFSELFLKRAIVGGFTVNFYWSSSESTVPGDTLGAYFQDFGVNGALIYPKSNAVYVRPIRAFGVAPTTISVFAIGGVTVPVRGGTPVSAVTAANGYTGTVTWSGAPTVFAPSTVYTATITLTADTGYTLVGVAANSFTVAGATSVTHSLDSGVITAVFAATAADPTVQGVRIDPVLSHVSSYDFRFTVQVTNYDAAFTYTVTTTAGVASINSTGLVSVTGLRIDQSATVTVTSTRVGYATGSASVTGRSQVAPMIPINKPLITFSATSVMCTIGSYSATPTSAVFSLFVDGKHVSTSFSATGEYLPDWIAPWATSALITRTATLNSASWLMSEVYQGKSISCSVIAYSNNAIGVAVSQAVIVK